MVSEEEVLLVEHAEAQLHALVVAGHSLRDGRRRIVRARGTRLLLRRDSGDNHLQGSPGGLGVLPLLANEREQHAQAQLPERGLGVRARHDEFLQVREGCSPFVARRVRLDALLHGTCTQRSVTGSHAYPARRGCQKQIQARKWAFTPAVSPPVLHQGAIRGRSRLRPPARRLGTCLRARWRANEEATSRTASKVTAAAVVLSAAPVRCAGAQFGGTAHSGGMAPNSC